MRAQQQPTVSNKALRSDADVAVAARAFAIRFAPEKPSSSRQEAAAAAGVHSPLPADVVAAGAAAPPTSGVDFTPGATATGAAPPRESLVRRVVRVVYGRVKRLIRPVTWRMRRYVNAPILDELAYLRAQVQQQKAGNDAALGLVATLVRHVEVLQESQQGVVQALARQDAQAAHLRDMVARLPVRTLVEDLGRQFASCTDTLLRMEAELSEQVKDTSSRVAGLAAQAGEVALQVRSVAQQGHAVQEGVGAVQQHVVAVQQHVGATSQQLERVERYAMASARRVAIASGDGTTLVRTEVGYLLCASDDAALLAALVEAGELEPGTRRVIQRLLRPGEVFVDVGANIGMHTLAAAQAMRGQGRIVAFEPFAPTRQLLERNVWMNGFGPMVDVHQAAAWNHAGTQTLHLGRTSGHHSLFDLADGQAAAGGTVQVPAVRLDDVIAADLAVTLVKVDVEGAELEVLEGARDVLRRAPDAAVIAEYGRSHLQRTNHRTGDWLRGFAELGLVGRVIDEATGNLRECSEEALEGQESANVLFARRESRAWTRLA